MKYERERLRAALRRIAVEFHNAGAMGQHTTYDPVKKHMGWDACPHRLCKLAQETLGIETERGQQ
jgi:hypothetical protein